MNTYIEVAGAQMSNTLQSAKYRARKISRSKEKRKYLLFRKRLCCSNRIRITKEGSLTYSGILKNKDNCTS